MNSEALTSPELRRGETEVESHTRETERLSKRIAIAVNAAKLLLLAALTPAVVTGIAQRASAVSSQGDAPALVAFTIAVGSLSAILGALALPALSDLGNANLLTRWVWVIACTGVGSFGLTLLAVGANQETLVIGWALAQLGYSGAMALLRTILASALPTHRRRGAVVVVVGAYAGLLIPLAVLIIAPWAIWHTTFGLTVLSLLIPAVFLVSNRKILRRTTVAAEAAADPAAARSDTPPSTDPTIDPTTDGESSGRRSSRRVTTVLLLVVQCCANIVMSAFLSFHALDIEHRFITSTEDFPVRASVGVLVAAVMGLITISVVLLKRPQFLAHVRTVIAFGGVILAASLIVRGATDSLVLAGIAAAMSGVAVGLNSSALLAAALEAAPHHRAGRFIGLFSAAGAAGQLIGPMLGLWVLTALSHGFTGMNYAALFFALASLPLLWSIAFVLPVFWRARSFVAAGSFKRPRS